VSALSACGRLARRTRPACGRRSGLHAANAGTTLETFTSAREGRILLRRLPTLAEVADVAALMASDRASAMTATIANVTCGEMLD
jgi:3-oxoacyl-[acyl-carrier protein] reductase